jgi:hypothetical protein
MSIDITQALLSLKQGAQWALTGEDYSSLEWLDQVQTKPTEAEINAEIARLQAEYDAKEYQRKRVTEYPSLQEQLDMQYWDSVNGTTTWQDAINAVKAKYPKA